MMTAMVDGDGVDVAVAAAAAADPAQGLAAVRSLHSLADSLEQLQVRQARELGWPWQDIGRYLGVSRQAVHRKYSQRDRGWRKAD